MILSKKILPDCFHPVSSIQVAQRLNLLEWRGNEILTPGLPSNYGLFRQVNFLFHNNFFIFIAWIINDLNNKLLKICIEMDYAREGVSINISLAPFGNLLEKSKKQKLLKRPKWPYFLTKIKK
jgi:hypothetical protein